MPTTPDLENVLGEFVTVTGISLDDPENVEKARALISRHGLNLNNAVLDYFENGLNHVPSEPISESVALTGAERFESSVVHRNLQDEFDLTSFLPQLPKAPRITNNWQFELGIHVSMKAKEAAEKKAEEKEISEKGSEDSSSSEERAPQKRMSFLWLVVLFALKSLSFLYSLVRYLLGLTSPSLLHKLKSSKFNYDDYEEGYTFAHDLAQFESGSKYSISTSNYNMCYEAAQKDYEFMLIVLVDNSTVGFVGDLLQSEDFFALFNKDTGTYKDSKLFFGNVDKDPEAFEVSSAFRRRNTPYVALVGNVSNNPAVMSSMSIIYKSSPRYVISNDAEGANLSTLSALVRHLRRNMSNYNPQLVTKRYDKQEMEFSRMLKEQQDEAYLESLQQDKIKKQEKESQSQEQERKATRHRNRIAFLRHIKESDFFQSRVENSTTADVVRVSIKLPDGKRLIQKFSKSSAVHEVYLFVEMHLVELDENLEGSVMGVEDYIKEYDFNFELYKPLPKTVLPSTLQSIEEFGALKSGDSILVEYLDD